MLSAKKIISFFLPVVLIAAIVFTNGAPAGAVPVMGSITHTTDGDFGPLGADDTNVAISGTGPSASVGLTSSVIPQPRSSNGDSMSMGEAGVRTLDGTTIVAAYRDNSGSSIRFTKSTDGGASWDTKTIVSGTISDGKVSLAIDDAGSIYAAYIYGIPAGEDYCTSLRVARSLDNGATWSTIIVDDAQCGRAYPSIDALPNGTVGISYFDGNIGALKFIRSSDFGATWNTPVTVDDINLAGNYPFTGNRSSLDIYDATHFFISYNEVSSPVSTRLKYAQSGDGINWTKNVIETINNEYVRESSIRALSPTEIYIAYHGLSAGVGEMRFARTTTGGIPAYVSTIEEITGRGSVSLDALTGGTLSVSYFSNDSTIRFARSTNQGTSWPTIATITSTALYLYGVTSDMADTGETVIGYRNSSGMTAFATSGYTSSLGTYVSNPIDFGTTVDLTALEIAQSANGGMTVYGQGTNTYGQLGNGNTIRQTSPAASLNVPSTTAVAGGASHTLFLQAGGTVKAAGLNDQGQLGRNNQIDSATPIYVCAAAGDCETNTGNRLSGVVGIAATEKTSYALLSNGTVKAWGLGTSGQIGNGANSSRYLPTTVSGIDGTTPATTAVAVAAGINHAVALMANGTVKAWGLGTSGQIGDSFTSSRNVPTAVTGIDGTTAETTAVAVAAGYTHSLALMANSTVKAWGANGNGQIGDGTTSSSRATPRFVCATSFDCETNQPNRLSGVMGLGSTKNYSSFAIMNNGTALGWGDASMGRLGNSVTSGNFLNPSVVTGLSDTISISGGGEHVVALLSDGTVKGWGYNRDGAISASLNITYSTPTIIMSGMNATSVTALGIWGYGVGSTAIVSGGTRVSMRTAATSGGLSSQSFIALPLQAGHPKRRIIPTSLDSKQWGQYKIEIMTRSGMYAPVMEEVVIYYPKNTPFDFTLSATPPSGSLGLTGSLSSTITVAVGAYDSLGVVNFTYAVSPNTATPPNVSLSAPSCTPSGATPTCSVTLNITRPLNVTTGNYTITIYGNNGTLIRQTSYALAVLPPLDFSLSELSRYSGEVIRGYETTSYIDTILTVQYLGGESEIVGISSDAPAGIIFDPAPTGCPPAPVLCQSTIRFSAASSVAVGDYSITIIGTAGTSGGEDTISFTLRVRDPLNFSLDANPSSGAVFQGNSTTSTITGSYVSGVAEDVSFSTMLDRTPASGMIIISFSSGACSLGPSQASCTKTMTIWTTDVTPGPYVITVRGTSSITGMVQETTYTLTVSGPFDFSMKYVSPPCSSETSCAGTAEQGTNLLFSFLVTSDSPAGDPVTITVSGLPGGTSVLPPTYNPDPCIPILNNPCTVTITISPLPTAQLGTFTLHVEGRSLEKNHSLSFSLTVVQGFTFTVSVDPSPKFVMKGGVPLSVTASVRLTGGAPKALDNILVSILPVNSGDPPSGVNTSFTSGSPTCTPDCYPQISFDAPLSAVLGDYIVTITAMYGSQNPQASFPLTVVDPFDFLLSLPTTTQGSVLKGGTVIVPVRVDHVAGGTGSDGVSLSAAIVPPPASGPTTYDISFSPDAVTVGPGNTPKFSDLTLHPHADFSPEDSYRIIITAISGTAIESKTYNLTVGTTLDFSLAIDPENERVIQGNSSGPITVTVTNTSPENQPSPSTIGFDIETGNYTLPVGVSLAPAPASCSLGAAIGATCPTSLAFNVGPTAISGTYNVPIIASSGPVKRIIYFTLKIGELNLVDYVSPNFHTDPHRRPYIEFSWDPPAIFAGDRVSFDARKSEVYAPVPGFVNSDNANIIWNGLGSGVPGNPLVLVDILSSGAKNVTVQIADNTGNSCYTSDSSNFEACSCTLTSSIGSGSSNTVSAPRPSFKEIKP